MGDIKKPIKHCCRPIQHCRSCVSTISNPKISLNDAIRLFHPKTSITCIQHSSIVWQLKIGSVKVRNMSIMAETTTNTSSQINHYHTHVICNIALGYGLETNVALGFALCCNSLSTTPLVLLFPYRTCGNALTST